ncbi:class I SAM-dependent methyltransferase [Hydrogenovibrio crunogenus]|uniref:Malonyl-[acyl-carrier protein] O-methyltransferase n=1 Tax=Hydrogenovibrio crunogenus TaxID=39765 RepID=A0A4P7P1K0_9GAMM|nr:malonyl-ACP O-methyltransferase BioC [Hydrogenovibrio crunogenus]QBZ84023.1 class I SAM-dependent methyltransferase [Hydrogenovibrio crunogenus]
MQKFSRAHIQKHFNHAAVSYDEAAVLQRQVASHVDERLELVIIEPKSILDVGAGTGILTQKLIQRYPNANIVGLDLSHNMLERAQKNLARSHWKGLPKFLSNVLGLTKPQAKFINADANHIPLADDSVDLIVTNLMLQWCDDLDTVFQEFRRVLKPEGLLMLTTFGPDTLKELRQAWSKVDGQEHVNTFIDMHDIGDALIRNGFGQPVMDVEHFTLTYEKPIGVLKDLKAIGATNATENRQHGLMGKQRFMQMLEAYEQQRQNGLIPATYEVIHGHAWATPEVIKGPNRNREGIVEISLDEFAKQTQSL